MWHAALAGIAGTHKHRGLIKKMYKTTTPLAPDNTRQYKIYVPKNMHVMHGQTLLVCSQ